jgi:pimeloyl-ACP methyl ester carboxylesterase
MRHEDSSMRTIDVGDGPPLLLLPPLPGSLDAWVECVPRLSRRFRVLSFDLREDVRGPAGWDALVDDVERVLDAHAAGPVLVAGHSLGGALALRWALRHPGRARALVLSSAFARVHAPPGDLARRWVEQPLVLASQRWLPERAALALAARLARHGRWVYDPACDARVLAMVRAQIRATPVRLALARVQLAFAHDVRAQLPQVAAPTLVVHGALEQRWIHAAAAELAGGIPGARRQVFDGVGHLHIVSAPGRLCTAIESWSEAHPAP